MGYKNRTEHETNNSFSLSEALIFATMCIIGLPVEVHVKDGSVYSGIFYTASVEKDYGIFPFLFLLFKVEVCVSFVLCFSFFRIGSGNFFCFVKLYLGFAFYGEMYPALGSMC